MCAASDWRLAAEHPAQVRIHSCIQRAVLLCPHLNRPQSVSRQELYQLNLGFWANAHHQLIWPMQRTYTLTCTTSHVQVAINTTMHCRYGSGLEGEAFTQEFTCLLSSLLEPAGSHPWLVDWLWTVYQSVLQPFLALAGPASDGTAVTRFREYWQSLPWHKATFHCIAPGAVFMLCCSSCCSCPGPTWCSCVLSRLQPRSAVIWLCACWWFLPWDKATFHCITPGDDFYVTLAVALCCCTCVWRFSPAAAPHHRFDSGFQTLIAIVRLVCAAPHSKLDLDLLCATAEIAMYQVIADALFSPNKCSAAKQVTGKPGFQSFH